MVDFKGRPAKYVAQFFFLLLGFFLDGSLKSLIMWFNLPSNQVSLQMLLFFLSILVLYDHDEDPHLFYYAVILGVAYDSYYSHIFGLYTIIFPITVILVQRVRAYVPRTAIFMWSIYFILLTLSCIYLYLIGSFLDLTMVDGTKFVVYWLAPSLLWNSICFAIFYYPINKLAQWLVQINSGS
ncbi:hypothetical protein JG30_09790 [Bombilactobacillus mellifer]|uniref:Uncharacterized protein n=1 Tax=Bombilactobacillus mellifer TaxID=1218492 RepID=A0A0F4LUI2_9LACO|nr:rod shape-determining protein MreD [Bombilactobacillus mellifer]MBH9990595.1 rod shape-determining protein MreD [Lactobacillus sp. W8092]KJY61924.1 hypothetical protein JG30_09790 [Bombilactobacillus mellifer]MCT6825581.1 rod shape-determining protein MreD [Bombilactobacillus mellifer]MCT6843372.1 rod shape-determining protein MreD [Bombilactobacillus mellifer]MCT6893824.1 rod shape-determining protein MreD [Bombilactobacillus mellifer]